MKKTIHAEHFFFCAFSDSESVVKHVTCMGDTEFPLHLRGQKICLNYQQGSFLVNTRPMLSDSLLLPDSEIEEKVLISRQGSVHRLAPTGRIRLEAEALVTLGSDYENRICYQFHSRVRGRHAVLVMEGENFSIILAVTEYIITEEERRKVPFLRREIPCSYTVFPCNFFPHISFMFHWLENAGCWTVDLRGRNYSKGQGR